MPVIHVEASEFKSHAGVPISPTEEEFNASLTAAVQTGMSVDVYAYHLLKRKGWMKNVRPLVQP